MRKTKYIVKPTTQFKKDFKLAMKRSMKIELLEEVIAMLAMGETLPDKHKDHALSARKSGAAAKAQSALCANWTAANPARRCAFSFRWRLTGAGRCALSATDG